MADGMLPLNPAEMAGGRSLHVLQIGMEWFTPGAAGGLSRYYTDLFKSVPGAGIELSGLVSAPAGVAALTAGRVQNFSTEGASFTARLLGARRAIGRAVRERQIDVIACHFALYGAPALDRMRRRPLVCHFHGPWAAESSREGEGGMAVAVKHAVETLVYRRAQRVIVLSKAFGEIAVRSYGVAEDRLRIVQGSVDIPRFAVAETRSQAREALGWPRDRPILLTVRRLSARMGLDRLIDAMTQIVAAVPEVLLFIAGKGAQAAALKQQTERLGLADNIRFLGFVSEADLPLSYRAADINILPTDALEGFGLSAAEALASGTPSMVTPVGGLPDVVADLSPDLIFQSSATDHLAESLIAALRGAIRLPDSQTCRDYAAARFSLELCGRLIADVYREAA